MKAGENFRKLRYADIDGIGNKARNLAKILRCSPSLFSVPDGVVLLPAYSSNDDLAALQETLAIIGAGPFAVRSCGLEEDGAAESLAGKFHTELFVEVGGLAAAIDKVRQSFGDMAAQGAVLIQEMIAPDYAGVLFTRSPENYGLASCEFCEGTADNLVSGKVEPVRVDYGRWSGKIFSTDRKFADMLANLFLVGLIIEEKMGRPQDIEWAFVWKTGRLYILQSRDITSQLYQQAVAEEQARLAEVAVASTLTRKGKPVFRNAAVREVVSAPTKMTRDLVAALYSVEGALGRAFAILGLPVRKITSPYVLSAFGRLYENIEVEKKLFGFSPKLLLANRKLVKQLKAAPAVLKKNLHERLAEIAPFTPLPIEAGTSSQELAASVLRGFRQFVAEVYPLAYATTLVAQLSGEETSDVSITGQIMRDLSRLHHTGNMSEFLDKWGLRSSNEYELSAPRFCEDPVLTTQYAAQYASFPWTAVEGGDSFTQLKEIAKDKAIRWLYPLRQEILRLEAGLKLAPGMIFHLSFSDVQTVTESGLGPERVAELAAQNLVVEELWQKVELGDELTLANVELLAVSVGERQKGLQGKMVSVRQPFAGVLCRAENLAQQPPDKDYILLTKYLEPDLVSHFPKVVGCLADMGGVLSHAAIVARELGLPVLVLATVASTLSEGMYVKVSEAGIIEIDPGTK